MTQVKQRNGYRTSCDVGKAAEGLESGAVTQVKRCKDWRMRLYLILQPFVASPTSQLILQPFRRYTYVIARSTTLPLLHLRHRHFIYVTAHSPTLPPLHLLHSPFYNPSVASPMSQLILQTFRRLTYVTGHFTNLPLLHLRHRLYTYVTWRAANAQGDEKTGCGGLACYSNLLSQKQLQFWIVVKNFTTCSVQ